MLVDEKTFFGLGPDGPFSVLVEASIIFFTSKFEVGPRD